MLRWREKGYSEALLMTFLFRFLLLALTVFIPVFAHCLEDSEVIVARPHQQASSWDGEALFELIPTSRSGVNVRYKFDETHPLKRLYPYGWATGNVAIGDVNGDNKADLFFAGTTGSHRLFIQRDGFRFEDVTGPAAIGGGNVWGSAAVMGDIDNDRDLDIYVVNFDQPNQLFVNISQNGIPRFVELAKEVGIDVAEGCMSASFADLDADGLLDLYLQTYHLEPETGRPEDMEIKEEDDELLVPDAYKSSYLAYRDKEGKPKFVEAPQPDLIFRNLGQGKFEPVPNSGIVPGGTYGTSHLWWDMDHDLRPDLYVGNDGYGPDILYRKSNQGFVDASGATLPVTPWNTRGVVAADFNNDLLIDCFAAGSSPGTQRQRLAYGEPLRSDYLKVMSLKGARQMPANALYVNTGTSLFQEIAGPSGLRYTGSSWAAKAGDYDCDGRADLFITNGEARDWTSLAGSELVGESLKGKTRWDILEAQPRRIEADRAYRNLGNWKFEEVADKWGVGFEGMSYAAGHGDLDDDGDLDLIVCTLDGDVRMYRNHSPNKRLSVQLFGIKSNRFGVGAELIAESGDKKILRQLYPTGGFKGSDEPVFNLGLGQESKVDRLTIRWAGSGATQTFEGLKAGFRYTVREAQTLEKPVKRQTRKTPMFQPSLVLRGAGKSEVFFDEYLSQSMLPPGLSNQGPAIAATDVDGDGLDEILLGGSAGNPTQLISRKPDFARIKQPFGDRRESEDGPSVFFDADNDGDADLYIASGGIEFGEKKESLIDRLYIQKEVGSFVDESQNRIPSATEVSSAVAVADFDRDGDLDLFVGARLAPGKYPESGRNRILLNDGSGKFSEVTEVVASGLSQTGMVTGAIWTDVDNDGWIDLMLACDMGSPQLWKNEQGKLTNQSAKWGLLLWTGRWSGISGGDFDNDGDIDYVLSNEGLGGDGGGKREFLSGDPMKSGKRILLTTIEEDGVRIPLSAWQELIEGDESIATLSKTSAEFAADGVVQLFAPEKVAGMNQLSLATLESSLLINQGEAGFEVRQLPRIVQIGRAYGSVVTDVNFDGRQDIYLVQNRANPTLRNPDPATRGVSQLLLGKGTGEFDLVSPDQSGLVVFGGGRGVITTDLNKDSKVDLLVSLNVADPAVFVNFENETKTKPVKVSLGGSGKSPAGARVTLTIPGFPVQTAEYYAGGGFYSQSSPDLFFGAPSDAKSASAEIKWGDGTLTSRKIYFD